MKKEIRILIEGTQRGSDEEPVVSMAEGTYHYKNGSHYIRYEEKPQDGDGMISNTIKISPAQVYVSKKGALQAQMAFDTLQPTSATYYTAYGNLSFGVRTKSIRLLEGEDRLQLKLEYSLTSDGSALSDNIINIDIRSAK
jgi:uncharacterized beta-barrel protein YwiB (DUF1934 family)